MLVRRSNVDEVLLAKSVFSFAAGCQGFWYEGGGAGLLAGTDFRSLVIASIFYHRQRLSPISSRI